MPFFADTMVDSRGVPVVTMLEITSLTDAHVVDGVVVGRATVYTSSDVNGNFSINLEMGDYNVRWRIGSVLNQRSIAMPATGGPYGFDNISTSDPIYVPVGQVLPATVAALGGVKLVSDGGTVPTVYRREEVDAMVSGFATQADIDEETAGRIAAVEAETTARIADVNSVRAGDINDGVIPSRKLKTASDADKVQLGNLGDAVIASLAGGLDPADYLGQITALNQAIATAASSNGKWYSITVAGTLSGTNAPAIAVAVGDRLLSNGTLWQLYKAPPTTLSDASITEPKYGAGSVSTRALGATSVDNSKLATNISAPLVVVGADNQNIEFAVTDRDAKVVFGIRTDATVVNPQIEETIELAEKALPTELVMGNPQDINFAVVDDLGKVLIGLSANALPVIPGVTDRIDALEAGSSSSTYVEIVPWYGQSNAQGALDYSQTWRHPYLWGSTPPGFAGEADGSSTVTSSTNAGVRTMASSRASLVVLAANGYGIFGSNDTMHGFAGAVLAAYPTKQFVMFSHAVGGKTIAYLDKPTPAEITAGSASGITIGVGSAEKLMQAAGQTMESILLYDYTVCATPYFQGMWLIAKIGALLAIERKRFRVPALVWIQGNNDVGTPTYRQDLLAFTRTYSDDVRRITGQFDPVITLAETIQFSEQLERPGTAGYDAWAANSYAAAYDIGGASSQHRTEANRLNDGAALNKLQLQAALDSADGVPPVPIVTCTPRYPYTNRVHFYPHAYRALGEVIGKVYRKRVVELVPWEPLYAISWWIAGASVFIRFKVPKTPVQFALTTNITTHSLKTGKPYGFEHSAGAIQLANVRIAGPDLVQITPDVAPAVGHTIGYCQTVRFGSLCDSDLTPPVFTDRASVPNAVRNYCIPFLITL